jgi:hypothetical protein
MATDWPSIDPNHPTDPTVETTIMRPGFRSCRRDHPGTPVLRAIELVRATTDSGSDFTLHWHGAERQTIVLAPA